MRKFFTMVGWAVLCWGLLCSCQPRNIIPTASGSSSTVVSACSAMSNCGQCVSDARCGWCGSTNRCQDAASAASCTDGYIAKDPEQSLCPASPPPTKSAR